MVRRLIPQSQHAFLRCGIPLRPCLCGRGECALPAAVPDPPRRLQYGRRADFLWYVTKYLLENNLLMDITSYLDGYLNSVSNRTEFPLSGGFFSLNSEHTQWVGQ